MAIEKRGDITDETPQPAHNRAHFRGMGPAHFNNLGSDACCGGRCKPPSQPQTKQAADDIESNAATRASDAVAEQSRQGGH